MLSMEKNGNDTGNDQSQNGQKKMMATTPSQPDGECSELIRKFEAKYKVDMAPAHAAGQSHVQHSQEGDKESPTDQEHSTGSSEEASSSGGLDNTVSGGNSPPKPMPRTSRNNSLPEASDSAGESSGTATPRPRPRTTAASAYKVPTTTLSRVPDFLFFIS